MFPVDISFRGFSSSEAVRKRVHQEALKLDKVFPRVQHCNVVISLPHRTRKQGKIFHVHIKLHIPGQVLVVNHEPELNHAHEDPFVAIRDSFRSMKNELVRFTRKRDAQRVREPAIDRTGQKIGVVKMLDDIDGYGFVRGDDQVDYYFHENSVLMHSFNKLKKGDHVRFVNEMGEKGPQASSLSVINSG